MTPQTGSKPDAGLWPALAGHLRRLATVDAPIAPPHAEAARRLASWLLETGEGDGPRDVVVVCTGNSRRSMLGAMMGNAAAASLGLSKVRFFSAGTAPSAFNPRTIAALESAGFVVEATGEEAARGEEDLPNPRYRVRWGPGAGCETVDFSKALDDPALPRTGFAALLVCTEAAEGCPVVPGASARIAMPLVDPKEADGSPEEAARYAATRDEVARILLAALAPPIGRPGA